MTYTVSFSSINVLVIEIEFISMDTFYQPKGTSIEYKSV